MRAARTYARRGTAPPNSWHGWTPSKPNAKPAADTPRSTPPHQPRRTPALRKHRTAGPDWFNWFSPISLASFKGDTQLKAGQPAQAKATLLGVLDAIGDTNAKQRTVILGDLAAVEIAQRDPEAACSYAEQALDQLAVTWYATGMDRVHDVRRALQPWADTECVRRLDDRLYGWQTTLSALQR